VTMGPKKITKASKNKKYEKRKPTFVGDITDVQYKTNNNIGTNNSMIEMKAFLKDSSDSSDDDDDDNDDNKSTGSIATTDSYRKRIQEAELMLERDASRKKKRTKLQEMKTISEVMAQVEQEIGQTEVEKPMETVMVSTGISSKSSITTNTTSSEIMNRYINTCGEMGIIDTIDTQEQHFKKMTRQRVWRYFKLVDEDQYNFGTSFVTFICNQCNRNIADSTTPEWWNNVKHYVQRAMMDMRSSCTQAMKRSFLGKTYFSIMKKTLLCLTKLLDFVVNQKKITKNGTDRDVTK
jgi:hypothetical protein